MYIYIYMHSVNCYTLLWNAYCILMWCKSVVCLKRILKHKNFHFFSDCVLKLTFTDSYFNIFTQVHTTLTLPVEPLHFQLHATPSMHCCLNSPPHVFATLVLTCIYTYIRTDTHTYRDTYMHSGIQKSV